MRTMTLPPQNQRTKQVLKDSTIRDFGGGWNVIDNELNLSTKYATILDNMSRDEDGSIGVRWGTVQHAADVGTVDATVINVAYFQDSIIAVRSDGTIARVLADGTFTVVWDATIAAGDAIDAAPWGPTTFASFAVFDGDLIICNGSDKPLIVNFDNATPVTYLHNLASLTNGNVPICRYVVAMNHYLVMAGDPLNPDVAHISMKDASGTWEGDADAGNDAVSIDLGKVGVQGNQTVTGLNRYRDRLVVGFEEATVLGTLGIYDLVTGEHTPDFSDVIEGYGCHSHRSMVNLGNDLFMLDHSGIPSIQRTLVSGAVDPKRVSELIDPSIVKNVTRLSQADTLLNSFALYNANDKQYMLFVPNYTSTDPADAIKLPDEPLTRNLNNPQILRIRWPAHGLLVGDKFALTGLAAFGPLPIATVNGEWIVQRVIDADYIEVDLPDGSYDDPYVDEAGGGISGGALYYFTETYGYIYTFVNELKVRAWSRFRGWKWTCGCVSELGRVFFSDGIHIFRMGNVNEPVYSDFEGTPEHTYIGFAWELPWADFDKRMNIKHMRYIGFDTKGTNRFLCMMFVDNIYKQQGSLIPNNITEFIGGDAGGYGKGAQPYGSGRLTSDERLYAWTARMKLGKLRFQGQATEPLKFISISVLYQDGDYRR